MTKSNKKVSGKIFKALQTLGPSLTMGIAVIPLGGLLMGISSILTNTTFIETLPFLGSNVVVAIATLFSNIGNMIINNLPIIFAVSVATSYCKKDGVAAFSAVLGFLAMHTTIGQILNITVESTSDWTRYTTMLGIPTLNVGVIGGMICGFMVVIAYNMFKDIKLPQAFSFFQGKRFVPLASIVICAIVAIPISMIWPFIQNFIATAADSASGSYNILTMTIMSVCTILLIPLGLHTFLYATWAYQLGTYVTTSGEVVHGFLTIFLAQMADGVPLTTFVPLTANYLLSGVLIGVALAIIKEANAEQKESTKSLFSGGIITNLFTGITEPLFFPYVFSAPLLYGVAVVVLFFGEWAVYFLNSAVGISYCGGLVDFLIYGVLQNAHNWFLVPVICIILGVMTYWPSRFLIRKLHLNVPGQESFSSNELEQNDKEFVIINQADALEVKVLKALGEKENIEDIDACATRLRVNVKDHNLVNKNIFNTLGASGVMAMGNNFQIVFGTQATLICEQIKAVMQGKSVVGTVLDQSEDVEAKDEIIVSPASGKILNIKEVPDKIFSEEMMGCGFAIDPIDGMIVSPVDGEIDNVFPTKHAIGIISECGKEILVHLGIDTVKLEGKGFNILIKPNDKVKAGQPICKMDLDVIKENGFSTISPIIFTNMNTYKVVVDKEKDVNKGDKDIIHFEKRN